MHRIDLEKYISARNLNKEFGISASKARSWRYLGKIRAKKIEGIWYYSREELSKLVVKSNIEISLDGEPSTLEDMQDAVLLESLGEYMSAEEVCYKLKIDQSILQKWRSTKRLRARKIHAIWYYSKQDLLEILKTY